MLLIAATVGAFFITQRLEQRPPPNQFASFTPKNGETLSINFSTDRADRVTLGIFDEAGIEVRRLSTDQFLPQGAHSVVWDGRTSAGQIAHVGTYSLRVTLRTDGYHTVSTRPIVKG